MFCSYCGQAAAANASRCANCGKPLRPAPGSNPALIAVVVILAVTTVAASAAALYYERQVAHIQDAFLMQAQLPAEHRVPPPPPPPAAVSGNPVATLEVEPCVVTAPKELGVGVPGGVPGGVLGGVIGEAPSPPVTRPKQVPEPPPAPPELVSQTTPVYPPLAKQHKIQGPVVVKALIDKEGRVASARVLSGHPLLEQSALAAVRTWRFKPSMLNGTPVMIETTVTVQFKLAQ